MLRVSRLVVGRRFSSAATPSSAKPATPKTPVAGLRDIATDEEQATGMEKRELDAEKKGVPVFGEDTLYGPFGTPEKPVIVPSVFDTRIVGCIGGKGHEHDLTWHVVSNGRPLVCVECGQVFQLRKFANKEQKHHH